MRRSLQILMAALALSCVATGLLAVRYADAAAPEATSATLDPLTQAANRGAVIFAQDKFGGARTCSSCHINGGKTPGILPNGAHIPSLIGAAAQFPRYNPRTHQIVTLELQIVHCIEGGIQGKPPAYNSPQMIDLIVYLTSLSKGSVMGKQFR